MCELLHDLFTGSGGLRLRHLKVWHSRDILRSQILLQEGWRGRDYCAGDIGDLSASVDAVRRPDHAMGMRIGKDCIRAHRIEVENWFADRVSRARQGIEIKHLSTKNQVGVTGIISQIEAFAVGNFVFQNEHELVVEPGDGGTIAEFLDVNSFCLNRQGAAFGGEVITASTE